MCNHFLRLRLVQNDKSEHQLAFVYLVPTISHFSIERAFSIPTSTLATTLETLQSRCNRHRYYR